MIKKQDIAKARTPADLEQRYKFGQSFAEVAGLAQDAQKAADVAQKAADEAKEALSDLDQEAIFNLLTNNGAILGLFMENGQLYINASYLKSGKISADLIDTNSLVAEKLTSADGDNRLVIDSAQVELYHKGKEVITLWNDPTASYGRGSISVNGWRADGYRRQSYFTDRSFALCAHEYDPYGKVYVDVNEWDNDRPYIEINGVEQDYIVEQSTSGIWTYRKWSSGIKECWGTVTHTVTVNTAWGSLYESAAVGGIDFPFTFDSVPSMQLSVVGTSAQSVSLQYPHGTSHSTTVSNTGDWYYVRPDAIHTSFTVTTAIRAIGK